MHTENSLCKFRFGVDKVYTSNRIVHISVYIGSSSASLAVYVVSCNIPLLLSRISLKTEHATLDFQNYMLFIFNEAVPLITSDLGHYCLPLSRSIEEPQSPETIKILLTSPINKEDDATECRKKITKLHKQFAYPHADKLKNLIKVAGTSSKYVLDMVQDVTNKCDLFKRYKHSPPKPAVCFPMATEYTVALDFKVYHTGYMLHMILIDHATRYSQACFIKNKQCATIVKSILKFWISIFDSPNKFLSDNGSEFVNKEFNEMAEKFNITVLTTAAESPWSNGLCEKHNGIIGDMIHKTMNDGVHDLELAIHWCISAKKALHNVYGYSPNQLVLGRNPSYPAVYSDKPPAHTQSTIGEHILRNLQALHLSRESFMKQESCERLRRALARKTRNTLHFINDDSVFYKRNNRSEWHSPAKVLGKDSHQYLLKHGGIYVRVHPCRMQLTSSEYERTESQKSKNEATCVRNPPNDDPELSDSDDNNDRDPLEPVEPLSPEPEPPEPPESPMPAMNTTIVKTVKDLPLPQSSISYRTTPDGEWIYAEILSKTGKVKTNNWHYMNIKQNGTCVSLKEVEWKREDQQPAEEIYFATDGLRFNAEKFDEILKWKDMGAYEEVDDTGQPRISCRWVCTEKMKGDRVQRKARSCARSYEEVNNQVKRDSPTCHLGSYSASYLFSNGHSTLWILKVHIYKVYL